MSAVDAINQVGARSTRAWAVWFFDILFLISIFSCRMNAHLCRFSWKGKGPRGAGRTYTQCGGSMQFENQVGARSTRAWAMFRSCSCFFSVGSVIILRISMYLHRLSLKQNKVQKHGVHPHSMWQNLEDKVEARSIRAGPIVVSPRIFFFCGFLHNS
jgi:hypothetical protein